MDFMQSLSGGGKELQYSGDKWYLAQKNMQNTFFKQNNPLCFTMKME